MIFTPLASSSAGNAYLVDDGETKILIECGISFQKLKKLLGFDLGEIAGVLVSHEHKDHSGCAVKLLERGMNVYMSEGTALALELGDGLLAAAKRLQHREPVTIGTMQIIPFTTYHDAAEPLGFLVQSLRDGDVLVFAIDTVNLRYKFPGLNILAIEANYDSAILARCTKIPDKTVKRIKNTHMEISTLCDILADMDLSRCREIHLMHMSDGNSHEGNFIYRVQRCVPAHCKVTVCPKGG